MQIGLSLGITRPFGSLLTPPLLVDLFTTVQVAPLGNRICQPGPGQLNFTDSVSGMAITSPGVLAVSGTFLVTDGWIGSASYARAAGLAIFGQVPAVTTSGSANSKFGWSKNGVINGTDAASLSTYQAGAVFGTQGPAGMTAILPGSTLTYDGAVVCRGTGYFYLVRGSGQDWKLGYVTNTDSTTPLWPRFQPNTSAINLLYENVEVVSLPPPWNTDNGIALAVDAAANANDTVTGAGDVVLEATRTIATSDIWNIIFRQSDPNNYYYVSLNQAQTGTTAAVTLHTVVAGVDTTVASGTAQTLTNATSYRVVVAADGVNVQVWVNNVSKVTYASATFNAQAMGCGTSLSCANLVAWPRTLSGVALAALARAYPYGAGAVSTVYVDNTLGAYTAAYVPSTRASAGGAATAYPTFAAAYAHVANGGLIIVRAGTYQELGAPSCCFLLATASKSVTVQPYAGDAVTFSFLGATPPLDGSGGYGQIFNLSGVGAGLTLDGSAGSITITGTQSLGNNSSSNQLDVSLYVTGAGSTLIVRNVTFAAGGHASLKSVPGSASSTLCEFCVFTGGGVVPGLDHDIYVANSNGPTSIINCDIHGSTTGAGIQVFDTVTAKVTIAGNAIWGNQTGIIFTTYAGHAVVNNTVVGNVGDGILMYHDGGAEASVTFADNISFGNNTGSGGFHDLHNIAAAGMTGSNNFLGTVKVDTGTVPLGSYAGTNDRVGVDPKLVNETPASFADLRLAPGSPCVGAGLPLGYTLLSHSSTSAPAAGTTGTTASNAGAFDS